MVLGSLRRLIRSPKFTGFALATMGLGIGSTAAAYAALLGIRHQTSEVREPEQIVTVRQKVQYATGFSLEETKYIKSIDIGLREVTAVMRFRTGMSREGRAEIVEGEAVGGNYFQSLGIQPELGRLLQPTDDLGNSQPVAVISHALWRRLFRGSGSAIGQQISLSGRPFIVVGVAPRQFNGVPGFGVPRSVWAPVAVAPWSRADLASTDARNLTLLGRLRPDVSRQVMAARVEQVLQQLDSADTARAELIPRRAIVEDAFASSGTTQIADSLLVLIALPAIVLVIATTNLANLAMSRGAFRSPEFALRAALGASRTRLVAEQMCEGAIVASAGGLIGCVVCWGLLVSVNAYVSSLGWITPSEVASLTMTPTAFAGILLSTLVAFIGANVFPVIHIARLSMAPISQDHAGVLPRWRGRSNIIALQVGATICLLSLTLQGMRTAMREGHLQSAAGVQTELVQADMPFREQERTESAARRLIATVLEDLGGRVDISNVAVRARSIGSSLELRPAARPFEATTSDATGGPLVLMGYRAFQLLGVPIIIGRSFDGRDGQSASRVVVINASLARRLFGRVNAVGEHVLGRGVDIRVGKVVTESYEVVGVAEDARLQSGAVEDVVYAPFSQHYVGQASILARPTQMNFGETLQEVRTSISAADPDLALSYVGRADPERWWRLTRMRMSTGAAGLLAVVALVLAMVGLYGVLTYNISRRTRELGLRAALGANSRALVFLVMRDGFRPILEGVVLGTILSLVLGSSLASVLTAASSGFSAIDTTATILPVIVAGSIASYVPARRALRVDPSVALRTV
jgi:putative ABC transport system permease protein